MISFDYSIDECVKMLHIMETDKLALYKNTNTPPGIDPNNAYYITSGGYILCEKNLGNPGEVKITLFKTDSSWSRRISMVVSFAYNRWLKSTGTCRLDMPNIERLINRFHGILPRKSVLLT